MNGAARPLGGKHGDGGRDSTDRGGDVRSVLSGSGRYRASPKAAIIRAARVIPEGFWTSYGEIALAVTGTPATARVVGRTAASDAAFPNAWRVIYADGSIPDGWGGGGAGPARCRAFLEAEGVPFSNGRADPAKKILAEELELLLAQAAFAVTS